MITNDAARHNEPAHERRPSPRFAGTGRTPLGPGLTALMLSLSILAGCNGEQASTEQGSATRGGGEECPVTIDVGAWRAFTTLGERISAHEPVTRQDLEAFADVPVMVRWRHTQAPAPPPVRIGNWLTAAFEEELGTPRSGKHSSDRFTLKRSYRYSFDNRVDIDKLLREMNGPARCELDRANRYWVDPDVLPEPLVVNFLPVLAEVRTHEGQVFADTGLLLAGGVEQTARQITALLYRNLMAVPGANPLEATGELAVAHSIRALMNEAVASWIEQGPYTHFREDHPELARVVIIPEVFFQKTVSTIGLLEAVKPLLADPDLMAEKGQSVARSLFASGSLSQAGYGMADLIEVHLGRDRLREAGRSAADFLAAYQEAALLNPVPAPPPGTLGAELHESLPPLDPETYSQLHELLVRSFGE